MLYVPFSLWFKESHQLQLRRTNLQATPLEEQLEELSRAVAAGKVRHVGLSNETAWGVMTALQAADAPGSVLPRISFLQNAYRCAL